jgi:hypothetical protein
MKYNQPDLFDSEFQRNMAKRRRDVAGGKQEAAVPEKKEGGSAEIDQEGEKEVSEKRLSWDEYNDLKRAVRKYYQFSKEESGYALFSFPFYELIYKEIGYTPENEEKRKLYAQKIIIIVKEIQEKEKNLKEKFLDI